MKNYKSASLQADFIGWKAYKNIAKKAMDKEFSWSGLSISLSIAFFVVIVGSYSLNILYQTLEAKIRNTAIVEKVYFLEDSRFSNLKNDVVLENQLNEL